MPTSLSRQLSDVAAAEFERFVPRPVRSVIDRTLVDVACANQHGILSVADQLHVDVPAVDAWRRIGVPAPFRTRLAAMAMLPRPGRCSAGERAA